MAGRVFLEEDRDEEGPSSVHIPLPAQKIILTWGNEALGGWGGAWGVVPIAKVGEPVYCEDITWSTGIEDAVRCGRDRSAWVGWNTTTTWRTPSRSEGHPRKSSSWATRPRRPARQRSSSSPRSSLA